jgi:hypothetical protein
MFIHNYFIIYRTYIKQKRIYTKILKRLDEVSESKDDASREQQIKYIKSLLDEITRRNEKLRLLLLEGNKVIRYWMKYLFIILFPALFIIVRTLLCY